MLPQETHSIRARFWIRAATYLLLGLFGALTLRLGYWQIYRGPELASQAVAGRSRVALQPALRGSILDRNGNVLAQSRLVKTVWADPQQVQNPAVVAGHLSSALGIPVTELKEVLEGPGQFVYVRRKVTDDEAARVQALIAQNLVPGVYLMDEPLRVYPNGALAAHALGFTGVDDQGLSGLEQYYDAVLSPRPGERRIETAADGTPVDASPLISDQPGITLHTTLNLTVQSMVEAELERTVKETRARRGGAVVMDVDTGEILALAAYPDFAPDDYGSDPELWRNWLVTDPISPGSIFKPLTAAAALEEGLIDLETEFVDEQGYLEVQGIKLWNWNKVGTGKGTLARVMQESSNVGFATIALKLGAERFYRWMDIFNLTRPTGIDLPGEVVGIRPVNPTELDVATMGFGQTATETPVQMLAAINAIANSGRWIQPHLVKGIGDPAGTAVQPVQVISRPVISPQTARELWSLMESVVNQGTAQAARVEGYRVAGKTGTATKYDAYGREIKDRYIASFVGFVPADKPEVTVLILLDEPQGERMTMGGQVAAPLFRRMLGSILIQLGIPPAGAPDEPPAGAGAESPAAPAPVRVSTVPGVTLWPVDRAVSRLEQEGYVPVVSGTGPMVTSQEPGAGSNLAPGATVTLQAQPPPAGGPVPVPDLSGLTLRQAGDLLTEMGLEVVAHGGGAVTRQSPAPGTPLPVRGRVEIWLEH